MVPLYSPISSSTWRTNGFTGRRSSTGGSSPAATMAASMGDSRYLPIGSAISAGALLPWSAV